MTRINLIPVEHLMDQHLFAEFREIKMVPKALARSIAALQRKGLPLSALKIPSVFTLNAGHVSFFYDKGLYLAQRYERIKSELRLRGVQFNEASVMDPDGVYSLHPSLFQDYEPDSQAIETVSARIEERIMQKPDWYRKTYRQGNKHAICT